MPQVVATRYAEALADTVLEPRTVRMEPAQAVAELRQMESMLSGSTELRNVLLSPAVSASRKRAVIARFAEILPLSPLIRNFLYVLIDRRRIGMFSEVRGAFEAALDARLGIVRAQVRSATPLSDQQKSAVQAELSQMSGKRVVCEFSVDDSLLGGVVARIGSTIYDGSVRGQLEAMRHKLTGR